MRCRKSKNIAAPEREGAACASEARKIRWRPSERLLGVLRVCAQKRAWAAQEGKPSQIEFLSFENDRFGEPQDFRKSMFAASLESGLGSPGRKLRPKRAV